MIVEPSQSKFAGFSEARHNLLAEPTQLHFRGLIQWNIEALSQVFTEWLTMDEVHSPATSKVGMLSSVECQEILQQNLSEHICSDLRLLVKLSSLLYSCRHFSHPHYSHEQMTITRRIVGARLLKSLEIALKTEALAQASRAQLLSLFIVLSGAIIAVKYTLPVSSEDVSAMLLRILAHYMVLVGERVGLFANDLMKMSLTEGSDVLWNKTEIFQWTHKIVATGRESATESPILECLSPGFETRRRYQIQNWHSNFVTRQVPERSSRGLPWKTDYSIWHNIAVDELDLTPLADPMVRQNQPPILGLSNSILPAATRYCFFCNNILSIEGLCHTCLGSFLPNETADCPSLESLAPSSAPVFAHPDMPYAAPLNTKPLSAVRPINYWQNRDLECRTSDTLGSDSEVLTLGRPMFQHEEATKRKELEPENHFLRPKQRTQKSDPPSTGYFLRSRQHTVNESLQDQGLEPTTSPTATSRRKRKHAPSPQNPNRKAKISQRQQKIEKSGSPQKRLAKASLNATAASTKQKRAPSPKKPYKKAKPPQENQRHDVDDRHPGSKDQCLPVTWDNKQVMVCYMCLMKWRTMGARKDDCCTGANQQGDQYNICDHALCPYCNPADTSLWTLV